MGGGGGLFIIINGVRWDDFLMGGGGGGFIVCCGCGWVDFLSRWVWVSWQQLGVL